MISRKCHFIPELKIAISRMSFLLSPHFPEFEIVQNDILWQNVIFPKMAFCLRMSFCTKIGNIISLNCKSEMRHVCNVVEGQYLKAMEIMHHHDNDCFDWLISGQQSINPWREKIFILSGKYKRFTFVHFSFILQYRSMVDLSFRGLLDE